MFKNLLLLFQTEMGFKILQLTETIKDDKEWKNFTSDNHGYRFVHLSGWFIDVFNFSISVRFNKTGFEPKLSIIDRLQILIRLKRFIKEYKNRLVNEMEVDAINDINLQLYKRMIGINE